MSECIACCGVVTIIIFMGLWRTIRPDMLCSDSARDLSPMTEIVKGFPFFSLGQVIYFVKL